MTVMTHVKALQAGHSSQGTSEPITPVCFVADEVLNDGTQQHSTGSTGRGVCYFKLMNKTS